ncbi:MAG: helix-turn-helix domain-containing protein [bacterium]
MDKTDIQASLVKKLRRKTSILSDAEVAAAVGLIRSQLKASFGDIVDLSDGRIEDMIRWSALGARCEHERDKRGLSVRDISLRLKIPQYRLKAIESGILGKFEPEMARQYFRFLGIQAWLTRWGKANRELARRAGVIRLAPGSRRRAGPRRPSAP